MHFIRPVGRYIFVCLAPWAFIKVAVERVGERVREREREVDMHHDFKLTIFSSIIKLGA